ncbi:3-phosphoshikimate 1-carboxyvinyltransferase [Clostridium sp. BJN0001]|uniref:3-phosphoshikimate 1-carboxyvinyltransferase n=1 Tax=Clostridium sp. BJN0001 TaxID=2930219 RepID=UPI001FD1F45A|nr:3-phosphoshikimate 1-carboxyvinyltransferase [Clostridium sp. BJN0001]
MGEYKINPQKLKGEVKVPPSKSMAHRAIICAALSEGESIIKNVDFSDDIKATLDSMIKLGAKASVKEDTLYIKGISKDSELGDKEVVIDCNESGSTLRFIVPIALMRYGKTKFIGRGNLGKRPLKTYYDIFDLQNIKYSHKEGVLDLKTEGQLKSGIFKVRGDISSQFITGLLFVLPLLDGDSKIEITTNMESKGYIDMTLKAIKDFGVTIVNNDYKEFIIKGNQKYKNKDYKVEADYSQAAFYLCADALNNEVYADDLSKDSLQGDKEVIDVLERMGVKFSYKDSSLIGKVSGTLKGTVIDGSQCPDIIPVLALVCALSEGKSKIINAERLRIKECDRLKAVTEELNKLGADIKETEDGLIINGVSSLKGGTTVWSHKDHRIAMTLAVAATVCSEQIVIKDYECVSKSYPDFWKDYISLGGCINEWNDRK